MSVLKTYDKQVEGGRIIPVQNQVQKQSDLSKSFSETNFDVENPAPLGGNSTAPYDTSKTNSPLLNTFDKTSLDLENPTPVGGPNRTTAANIPAGTYQVTTDQGPLLYNKNNKGNFAEGNIVNKELNAYTPNNTYLDFISQYKNDNN